MSSALRRGSKYSKRKSRLSKKAYTNFGKAAKAKRTALARTKRARPASKTVKAQVVANATAIARLTDAKYGPLQKNYSFMPAIAGTGGSVHVTKNYPALLHLNPLYCGQLGEPAIKWIQANQQILGSQQPGTPILEPPPVKPLSTPPGAHSHGRLHPGEPPVPAPGQHHDRQHRFPASARRE